MVEERLEAISQLLLSALSGIDSIGLSQGRVGISLFFFEYYRLTGKRKYYDIGLALFESIYLYINQIANNIYLPDGLSGISWAVEYLAQNGFIEPETDEILDEICSALNANNPLDLSSHKTSPSQIVGYGMHYLARMRNPMHRPGINKNHLADKFITFQVVDYFVRLKEEGYFLYEVGRESRESLAAIILYLSNLPELKINHSKIELFVADYAEMAIQLINGEDLNNPRDELLLAYVGLEAANVLTKSDWKQQAQIFFKKIIENQAPFAEISNPEDFIQTIHLCCLIYQYVPKGKCPDRIKLLLHEMLAADAFGEFMQELISDGRFGIQNGLVGIGMTVIASVADVRASWGEVRLAFDL